MNMLKIISASASAIITLLILSLMGGCSGASVDRATWLIAVEEDTVSVGEVGETWIRLSERQRELFTLKDNTIGEYIVTYGQKILLQHELEEAGYTTDGLLPVYRDAWLAERIGEAARKFLFEKELEIVGDDDIDYFLYYLGEYCIYTVNPGMHDEGRFGPLQLSFIDTDILNVLDTLSPGEVGIAESGVEVRLDSIIVMDSTLIAGALADTASVRSNAASAIATARFNEMEENVKQSLYADHNLSVDSTTLEQLMLYYAGETEFPDGEMVLISSDLGSITVEELNNGILFYESRSAVYHGDQDWLDLFIEFMNYNLYGRTVLESESPRIIDSLRTESEKYLMDLASEEFYVDRIRSTVTVTRADMEDLFENLEEPFTIPEKRVLQAAVIPHDSLSIYSSLSPDERDEFILGMQGFPSLAADSARPHITRPLTLNEVPGVHGNEVFLIDPADTTSWLGPLELTAGSWTAIFRLIEVIPLRNATFDEVEYELRMMTTNRLEEQATVELFRELEEKFSLVINEDILEKLPEDIGSWAEL